jgi:hypothetical protein
MSSIEEKTLLELTDRLNEARIIIDEQGLYNIWDNIPKSNDPEFGKNGSSFNEAIRQNRFPAVFQSWSERVEDTFVDNNLDYLKYKFVSESGDARNLSQQHAAKFLRKFKALETIVDDPDILAKYRTQKPQIHSWPPLEFIDGVLIQGKRQHKFNDEDYVRLLNSLWDNRRIVSPSESIVFVAGKSISRQDVLKSAAIRDHARFKSMVTGVHKVLRPKRIALKISYPDDVLLVVSQDRL